MLKTLLQSVAGGSINSLFKQVKMAILSSLFEWIRSERIIGM